MSNHPGLNSLFTHPLMSAIAGRRTRRVARGVSISAGELSHTSTNAPAPLDPLEEAVLIVSSGLTGYTMHDGPLYMPNGGKELGTPFMHVAGRSASSPDNAQATTLFLINDSGIFLIKRSEPLDLPPKWEDWSESDWLSAASAVKVKISDKRLEFPRKFPYYLGWNKQMSNKPGTTLLLPVVDCTRALINILLILLSEPDGERPVFIDDWQKFKPKDFTDFMGWLATSMGFVNQQIPYQPIGGLKFVRSGFVNPDINVPLGWGATMRVDYEAFFLLQNLMLVGHSMGLGGWIHASVFPPYIFQRDPAKNWHGLGFRMHEPGKKWPQWPPVPSSQPHPVGIDGLLQGLCPPYVKNMDTAVDLVLEEKKVVYANAKNLSKSYNSPAHAESFLKHAEPYSKKAIEYTKEVCRYIHETYGRFPAHCNAFHLPGVWLQFSHLEMEYYNKFYNPSIFDRQSDHDKTWHG